MKREEDPANGAANSTIVVCHHDHILLLDSRDVVIPASPIIYCKYH